MRHSSRCSARGRRQATDTTATAETASDPGTDQTSLRELIEQANRYFNQAQDAQRAGNWSEYGRSLRLLEDALRQLEGGTQ